MVLNNVAVYEKNREIPNDGEMFHELISEPQISCVFAFFTL